MSDTLKPGQGVPSVLVMREGSRIGYKYGEHHCHSAKANMKSATENPTMVAEYLDRERQAGGPLRKGEWPGVHVSQFGVIPKPHQTGKWRLIVDVSNPKGRSVNDGIEAELCTPRYTSVDEAVRRSLQMGRETWLTNLDIEAAYRIVPVHP